MRKMNLPRPVTGSLQRHGRVLLIVGMLCLVASVAILKVSDVMTRRARGDLVAAQARLGEAGQLETLAIKDAARAKLAADLLKQATGAGFSAREWDERRFNMKQVSMSRDALNSLLNEVTRLAERLFAAEQFEISVKQQDEGLFSTPKEPGSELMVSLNGTLIFRAMKDTP